MLKIYILLCLMLFLSGCIPVTSSMEPLEEPLQVPLEEPLEELFEVPLLEELSKTPLVEKEPSTISAIAVSGDYICFNDEYYNNAFFTKHPDAIPSITFYNDGSCKFVVNYLEGVCDVGGFYHVDKDFVYIELELSDTIFVDKETGEKYMDDQYVFTIINIDKIIIDRDCYAVNAGDSFVRIARQTDNLY